MAVIKYEKGGKYYYLVAGNEANAVTYDVSASAEDKVKLSIIPIGDGTHLAKLTGYGATKNFASADVKPWDKYIPSISAIEIGAGVTSIGERLFRRHEAVKSLVFEDSDSIRHLGKHAFQGCQFGGEYSFPNLEDVEFAAVFSHCTRLKSVTLSENVQELALGAFSTCMNLESVKGLKNVYSIGIGAFGYTPKLESLDVTPDLCGVLESSFRLSGAMRYDPSQFVFAETIIDATPHDSFSKQELDGIRKVLLPLAKEDAFDADGQYQYDYINYCVRNGALTNIQQDGCSALSLYHAYKKITGSSYRNFEAFWKDKILQNGETLESGINSDINQMLMEMTSRLKWTPTQMHIKDNPEAAKRKIADELAAGRALVANFAIYIGEGSTYGHSVAVIGSNPVTDKLIIADSIRTSGSKGSVYEMSFEQLFGNFPTDCIFAFDVGGDG